MMRLTKSSFLFYFILQFKACVFTTILSPADRTLNGQDAELVCTYSTNIASTSTVYVNWLENGNIRGNIDNRCSDAGRPVDTTQYNFSCPSISNYTWTIKNAQESRNGTKWTCAIAIDSLTYTTSDPTTMYVISPITSVSIDGNANISADAGSQTTVSCTTSTGRPVSTIHWYFDAGTPSDTSDDEEITSTSEPVFDFGSETTSGSVTITADSSWNGWRIYATANNTESMTPIQSPNAVTLTVTGTTTPPTTSPPSTTTATSTTTASTSSTSTSTQSTTESVTDTQLISTKQPPILDNGSDSNGVPLAVGLSSGGTVIVIIIIVVVVCCMRRQKNDKKLKRNPSASGTTSANHMRSGTEQYRITNKRPPTAEPLGRATPDKRDRRQYIPSTNYYHEPEFTYAHGRQHGNRSSGDRGNVRHASKDHRKPHARRHHGSEAGVRRNPMYIEEMRPASVDRGAVDVLQHNYIGNSVRYTPQFSNGYSYY